VVEAIGAMERGEVEVFVGLGGNFAVAAPDPTRTFAAMRRVGLTVHIATKLNRTHLLCGRESLLLPCLGRTEVDVQAGGRQAVTVEDSMSMVHASRGLNPPASEHLRSEPWIVAGIAQATFGDDPQVDWPGLVADYSRIRDRIEAVFPDAFADYNARVAVPGGFRLPVPPSERRWATATGRARFLPPNDEAGDARRGEPDVLLLTTVRSHDQYNTTIYGQNDRYRGVFGRRDVVFANPADLATRGLAAGDLVDLTAAFDGGTRRVQGFTVVERDIPRGCLAAYYPETNALVVLEDHDRRSGTPAYKSVPVRLSAHMPNA
jgi:molybdopterin-dependent oxidoreductase alpha subunit